MLSFYTPRTVFKALIKQKILSGHHGFYDFQQSIARTFGLHEQMNCLTARLIDDFSGVCILIKFFSLLQLSQASVLHK
jgi:hypothetical protein